MKNLDILNPIVNATIGRNNTIDRVEQDWKEMRRHLLIINS